MASLETIARFHTDFSRVDELEDYRKKMRTETDKIHYAEQIEEICAGWSVEYASGEIREIAQDYQDLLQRVYSYVTDIERTCNGTRWSVFHASDHFTTKQISEIKFVEKLVLPRYLGRMYRSFDILRRRHKGTVDPLDPDEHDSVLSILLEPVFGPIYLGLATMTGCIAGIASEVFMNPPPAMNFGIGCVTALSVLMGIAEIHPERPLRTLSQLIITNYTNVPEVALAPYQLSLPIEQKLIA